MTSLTTARTSTAGTAAGTPATGRWLAATASRIGEHATRFGLVAVIAWIGAMKFTAYEAQAISGFVTASPLLSWAYGVFSVQGLSIAIGVVELLIATVLALGAVIPRFGVAGGIAAMGMFATTLSFLLSTPGSFEPTLGGFPALSVVPGQFLLKDLVLLGAAIWLLGRSLHAQGHARTGNA